MLATVQLGYGNDAPGMAVRRFMLPNRVIVSPILVQ